jgi:5-methylcytosine-specific restriction endonuclease McrA
VGGSAPAAGRRWRLHGADPPRAASADARAGTAKPSDADQRYCGEPTRDKYGVITRSAVQLRKFVAVFPCPATLLHVTSCQGWQIDHVIPRASGGCDIPLNMQWLPATIKTCADDACKDRWERTYHAVPRRPVQL